jgi:hypothetical protein
MVSSRICISCFNRGQEFLHGRNGKGHAPVLLRAVRPMGIAYSVDGGDFQTLRVSQSADRAELALATLRKVNGAVIFLPAAGEQLPEAQPGHSAICCCSIHRGPVKFRCIKLDVPIDGHEYGVEGVDDPDWQAPTGRRVSRQKIVSLELANAKPKPAPKPRCRKADDVGPLVRELRGQGFVARQIAEELNARNLSRGNGVPFTVRYVWGKMKAVRPRR